jgi:hypothetical protein
MSAVASANAEESVASIPAAPAAASLQSSVPGSISRSDHAETLQALRAAGLSEADLYEQRVALAGIEEDMGRFSINDDFYDQGVRERSDSLGQHQAQRAVVTNEDLDRENHVVVEILTDEEISALEKWFPRQSCTYALRFAVVEGSDEGTTDILWSIVPCRECDPSSRSTTNFVVRNRHQSRYR